MAKEQTAGGRRKSSCQSTATALVKLAACGSEASSTPSSPRALETPAWERLLLLSLLHGSPTTSSIPTCAGDDDIHLTDYFAQLHHPKSVHAGKKGGEGPR